MSRFIDADEVLRMMRNSNEDNPCDATRRGIWNIAHDCCISCVEATPTADVVEVVRCKNCKLCVEKNAGGMTMLYCELNSHYVLETHFCSYGERRANNEQAD